MLGGVHHSPHIRLVVAEERAFEEKPAGSKTPQGGEGLFPSPPIGIAAAKEWLFFEGTRSGSKN